MEKICTVFNSDRGLSAGQMAASFIIVIIYFIDVNFYHEHSL